MLLHRPVARGRLRGLINPPELSSQVSCDYIATALHEWKSCCESVNHGRDPVFCCAQEQKGVQSVKLLREALWMTENIGQKFSTLCTVFQRLCTLCVVCL